MPIVDSPDGKAGHGSAGKEHADVHRGSLYGGSDSDNDTHHLHESNSSETVADGGLRESTDRLARNVNGYDLRLVRWHSLMEVANIRLRLVHGRDGSCNQPSSGVQLLQLGQRIETALIASAVYSLVVAIPVSNPCARR